VRDRWTALLLWRVSGRNAGTGGPLRTGKTEECKQLCEEHENSTVDLHRGVVRMESLALVRIWLLLLLQVRSLYTDRHEGMK
jgi:hypothetical protein